MDGMKHCDTCLAKSALPTPILHASYLCYYCEKYFCHVCFEDHDKSHEVVQLNESDDDRGREKKTIIDRELNDGLRWNLMKQRNATLDARVYIEHPDDTYNISVTGMCGLGRNLWVVCDEANSCVKIFKIGSNDLIGIIQFTSIISDVQEVSHLDFQIKFMEKLKEEKDISSKYTESCVLAILLPTRKLVIFFGINDSKAFKIGKIRVPEVCQCIQSYDDKLFLVGLSYVCIMTMKGDILKIVRTDRYHNDILDMDVVSEICVALNRIHLYLLDSFNRICIINFDGELVPKHNMKSMKPLDITVDDDGNVYILSDSTLSLHRFDSELLQAHPLLGFTHACVPSSNILLYHRDKLYISHSNQNIVTIVKLN